MQVEQQCTSLREISNNIYSSVIKTVKEGRSEILKAYNFIDTCQFDNFMRLLELLDLHCAVDCCQAFGNRALADELEKTIVDKIKYDALFSDSLYHRIGSAIKENGLQDTVKIMLETSGVAVQKDNAQLDKLANAVSWHLRVVEMPAKSAVMELREIHNNNTKKQNTIVQYEDDKPSHERLWSVLAYPLGLLFLILLGLIAPAIIIGVGFRFLSGIFHDYSIKGKVFVFFALLTFALFLWSWPVDIYNALWPHCIVSLNFIRICVLIYALIAIIIFDRIKLD